MKIDGKALAETIFQELLIKTQTHQKKVCFVVFNSTPATETFVRMKLKAAQEIGVIAETMHIQPRSTDEANEALQTILEKKYDGIVIQLPLENHIDTKLLLDMVPVAQDIDLLSEAAKNLFIENKTNRLPPVAFAVWQILKEISERNDIDFKHKKIVLLGKGKLVGEPIMQLFDREHISYEAFDMHSDHEELQSKLLTADIVISGIGVPHFVKPDMIKDNVVLIDAGTSEQAGKLAGDIDPACYERASLYTPVPGGIGPLTVAGLFWNLFEE